MPEQIGTLEAIGIEVAKVFLPLQERVEAGEIMLLLAELGIEFPASLANDPDFQAAVTGVSDKVGEMAELVKALIDAVKAEDYTTAAEKTIALIELIAGMVDNIQTIADEIQGHGPYPGITGPELDAFVANLAKNVVDYLVVNYLQVTIPLFAVIMEFFGIIEESLENENSTNPLLPQYTKKNLRLDRIPTFLESPAKLAKELYDWGDTDFTGEALFKKLEKILNALGWPAVYDDSGGAPVLDLLIATMEPRMALSPKGVALTIDETIGGSLSQTFSQDSWTLEVGFDAGLSVGAGVSIQPNGDIKLEPPNATNTSIEGSAFAKWIAKDNKTNLPLVIFGATESSRLEAREISAFLGGDFVWAPTAKQASGSITAEMEIKEGKVVIKPGDPDGFLAQILPPDGFTVDFNIKAGLNSDKGFYFSGSGTLEFDIPVSITIGPISILNLTVGLSPGSNFTINVGADLKTELGPFVGIVENMGVSTTLSFPEDRKGNLGPVNFSLGFKPPNGIGLSLDAGVVKGGGYLMLDFEKGQYAGAIELDFQGLFGFTAIGIITTKFPDGSEGFSLLLIISVTFATPIPLSYNFYLSGLGGMIGLHRTVVTMALQQGVKEGSIDNILFPENIIANITKIISDLQAIFPAKQDQFVLGVMAKITWNTPALLSLEVGLVVEFPNPVKIVILGVIKCTLPLPDDPVLELNVAFAGIIDFENEIIMFDASIFNSRILTITLEGDMAFRISWGDQPDFLVSVGGFHPVYTPPAHLQLLKMKRITVNILSGNPSLVLTSYFAITTNTIQFGASIDFTFKVSKFKAVGDFGFDVLIQFSPFRFLANVHASISIKLGSSTLFSIDLEFNLEGPTPWRANGYGSFSILFVKFKVKFDKTWGEEQENTLPATSVLPLLLQEFEKRENWNATAVIEPIELVTLSNVASDETAILVKPFGSLEINQTVVPLDLTMSKFGNYLPDDISKVTIKTVSINGDALDDDQVESVKNSFAPAAYKEMSDDDKLKAPSYEKQNSGTRIVATDAILFDYTINRLVEYETILSDFEEEALGAQQVESNFFKPFISAGDVGRSPIPRMIKNSKVKADRTVTLADEQFVVVSAATLTNAHAGNVVFGSRAEADEYLKETIKSDPSKKGKIQISPAFQMVEA